MYDWLILTCSIYGDRARRLVIVNKHFSCDIRRHDLNAGRTKVVKPGMINNFIFNFILISGSIAVMQLRL